MDFKKPRVAIYYDVLPQTNWRNDGGSLFLSYNLRKILNGDDCSKDHKLISNDSGNVVHLSPLTPTKYHGHFDLHILCDYGEDGLNIPIDWTIPHPNAYWVADSHLGYDYRLKRAKEFDHVFVSHSPTIERFIADGIDPLKIHYMPWAAETDVYKPHPIIEKWDWAFIGYPNNDFRIDLIDRFVKEFGLGDTKGYLGWRMGQYQGYNVLDDCAKKLSQARICINESIKDDLNMRQAEIMACKKLLLTEWIPAIDDFFIDGEDLVTFKTIDEAIEKARYYLSHPEERERVANAGYEKFLKGWTYDIRTQAVLDVCLEGWRSSCPNVPACAPEYDPRGSLIPNSAIDYRLLSRSYGGQSLKKVKDALGV